MAGDLTEWENSQIEAIDKLIQKCHLRSVAFQREHSLLDNPEFIISEELMSERLRYFATDLRSVLDYLCYFRYCHNKNEGKPSDSQEARNVNFSYNELRMIFDVPLDGQGQPFEQSVEAKRFNTLRYLRNITVHRNLIHSEMPKVWSYENLLDGTREFTTERKEERIRNSNIWKSVEFSKGCWITLPADCLEDILKDRKEALLIILDRLLRFVIKTRNKMLAMVSGQIYEYNHDRVRSGSDTGVQIRGDRNYTWDKFDEKCGIKDDGSCLWAV